MRKPSNLMMIADSFYIPKNNEDAHFFCKSAQIIGLADGGSAWAKLAGEYARERTRLAGGEYARELMRLRNAEHEVRDYKNPDDVDPTEVLRKAFFRTAASKGSSTACLISLSGVTLRAANVGDSGFLVIRGGKTIYRSPVQRHRFNCPVQLHRNADPAEVVEELAVAVESGDRVIAGTNGLFDNLFPEDIERVVDGYYNCSAGLPDSLSMALATAARDKQHIRRGNGGDITIVVANVVSDDWSYDDFLDLHLGSSFV